MLLMLLWDTRGGLQAAEGGEDSLEVVALGAGAELEIEGETGQATGPNGVMVRHAGAVLTAKTVRVDRLSGWVAAEGEVKLHRDGQFWQSESLTYNFLTKEMGAESFRTGQSPFFLAGQRLVAAETNGVYGASYSFLTTDDLAEPAYRVRARRMEVVPGKHVLVEGATFYLGSTPVMYWPRMRRSLERHPNNWVLLPGYRSMYGPYLLTEYNWFASDQLSGAVHLDYRERRGFGLGPDLQWQLGRWGEGMGAFYYTRDEDVHAGMTPDDVELKKDRQRFSFSHRAWLGTNWTARAVVREQGDAYVVRDFFENEYRTNAQPATYLNVERLWPDFSLEAVAQYQINDFYQTVERLPDVRLTAVRQPLGVSPFYYEGESSLGYFRFRNMTGQGMDYAAWRGDSLHQVVLPRTLFGWLQVTPRVGGRFTHYGESEGVGTTWEEEDRWVFNTGAEVSAKASRVWQGARSGALQVNGLRHIVQPSVNYVYVPEPTERPPELPQFDYEIQTLRMLPLDYPDYHAIDSIDSQNVFRFGLRNKIQTRRDGEVQNLVHWSLFTDWRLDPRPGQGTFSDLFSDADFRPRSWCYLSSLIRYDIGGGQLRESDHRLTLVPGGTVSWGVGHRYLRDEPQYGDDYGNNLFFSTLYFRLNENWGFRMRQQFEARDGTMEEQEYTVYRDMRSWTSALSFRIRESRTGPADVSVGVTFSLKAFPRYKLGQDRVEPYVLHGN